MTISDIEMKLIEGGLYDLADEAEMKRLWLFCSYQQLWFSPQEIREKCKRGEPFSKQNWSLRDPNELLEEIDREIKEMETRWDTILERMKTSYFASSSHKGESE